MGSPRPGMEACVHQVAVAVVGDNTRVGLLPMLPGPLSELTGSFLQGLLAQLVSPRPLDPFHRVSTCQS